MKMLAFYLLWCCSVLNGFSQSVNDIGKISLNVAVPTDIQGLELSQLQRLQNKIEQIVTTNGLATAGVNGKFSISPTFIILESNIVEGGMAKITVSKVEFSLVVKQIDSGVSFSTITRQISGSGKSASLAVTNAISKISTSDPQYKSFIETAKGKIIKYYESNCSTILTKSEGLMLTQDYAQSLALLMSVPAEVNCYASVQERSMLVYQALQNQKCARQIQLAKTQMASKKYSDVLDIIAQIDPSASCFAEAQGILNTIENKLTEVEKNEKAALVASYKDPASLDQIRQTAIKTIAVSYANETVKDKTPVDVSRDGPATTTTSTTSDKASSNKHRYFALLMGVETYADPEITSLNEPIKDAELLRKVLVDNYTFENENITFLKNPTFEEISVAFEMLSEKVEPGDFLLVFYAGHGYFDEKTNIGYWLPSDAQKKNKAKWFRNSSLVENIRAINSRHTLLIADACFSGGIFKTRAPFNNASPDIADMMKRPSRKAMTSGSLTTVPDKSVFMKYLLKSLTENQNQYLPSEDLFDEIRISMKNNSDTKPLYGEIQNSGDEGGIFVLIRRN